MCKWLHCNNIFIHNLLGREPLIIREHPRPQCKVYGESVSFVVAATGFGKISYHWKRNYKIIDNEQIHLYAGMKSNTLHIASFAKEHEGVYHCVVSNEDKTESSESAYLQGTIIMQCPLYFLFHNTLYSLALSILSPLSDSGNKNFIYEDPVCFTVSAEGPGTITYRWTKDNEELTEGSSLDYKGVESSTLKIPFFSSKHNGSYTCRISNKHCSLTSNLIYLQGT